MATVRYSQRSFIARPFSQMQADAQKGWSALASGRSRADPMAQLVAPVQQIVSTTASVCDELLPFGRPELPRISTCLACDITQHDSPCGHTNQHAQN